MKKPRPKLWEVMPHSQWVNFCKNWLSEHISERTPEIDRIEKEMLRRPPIARYFIPEIYCPPGNRRDTMHWSKAHALRNDCFQWMYEQNHFSITGAPLPGKPAVVCVRFSSRATDARSNWDKFPVDSLRAPRTDVLKSGKVRHWRGLNWIKDDGPNDIDLHAWCEKGPKDSPFVYVRVYG